MKKRRKKIHYICMYNFFFYNCPSESEVLFVKIKLSGSFSGEILS